MQCMSLTDVQHVGQPVIYLCVVENSGLQSTTDKPYCGEIANMFKKQMNYNRISQVQNILICFMVILTFIGYLNPVRKTSVHEQM